MAVEVLFNPYPRKDSTNLFDLLHESGYLVVRGNEMFREKMVELSKLVVIQGGLQTTLPYAIDREEDDFTLSQMTEGAIDFLSRGKQGFFLMVEGGLIDYACHVNDAATAFREVEDFADAVQKAYEFYLKHPDETLIVVTADHETEHRSRDWLVSIESSGIGESEGVSGEIDS